MTTTNDSFSALAPDMSASRLHSIIRGFEGKRVLVIGDMVADEYLLGDPVKIAREAPVLLLEVFEERIIPGGAANPAVNAATLGAEVYLAGVVGNDASGRRLREAASALGIKQEGLLTDDTRPTTTKTRVMAGNAQVVQQHILRIDRVDRSPVGEPYLSQMIEYIKTIVPATDVVIFSDYENGMISPAIIENCLPLARELDKIVVVDSHGSFFRFQGITALTPNQPEAEAALGMTIRSNDDLAVAGERLLQGSNARSVLITRGAEGMSLFEAGKPPLLLPVFPLPHASNIVDANGAGDTVAATYALALAAGASMPEAAYISNAAASLVVRRLGCASNTQQELMDLF